MIAVVERNLSDGTTKALDSARDTRQVLILTRKGRRMFKSRASWMHEGKFGVMVHWVAPGPSPQRGEHITDLHAAAERFDIDRFLKDFRRTNADWLIFTIGQRTGFASPNKVMDRLAGPGHCTRRDLVLEIAREVKKSGSRFIAYIPCHVGGQPDAIKKGFAWQSKEGTAQEEFQRRFADFIGEYSTRFEALLDGWWFDGAYTDPIFHNSRINAELYLGASRAGNPNAIVAFNDASFCCGLCQPVVPGQDYLSGETEFLINGKVRYGRDTEPVLLTPATHVPQPPPDCLWHCLVPIDCMWATRIEFAAWQNPPFPWVPPEPGKMERPLYTVDDLATLVRDFKAAGGGVTFNVGIFQGGGLGPDTVAQLAELASRIRRE